MTWERLTFSAGVLRLGETPVVADSEPLHRAYQLRSGDEVCMEGKARVALLGGGNVEVQTLDQRVVINVNEYGPSFWLRPADDRRESAVAVVLDVFGRVLVVRDGERWGLPGGKVDPGERQWETATRELFEETGVWIPFTAADCLGRWTDYPDGSGRRCAAFWATDPRRPRAGPAGLETAWWPPEAIVDANLVHFPDYNLKVLGALPAHAATGRSPVRTGVAWVMTGPEPGSWSAATGTIDGQWFRDSASRAHPRENWYEVAGVVSPGHCTAIVGPDGRRAAVGDSLAAAASAAAEIAGFNPAGHYAVAVSPPAVKP